jgi:hypothetical protein
MTSDGVTAYAMECCCDQMTGVDGRRESSKPAPGMDGVESELG